MPQHDEQPEPAGGPDDLHYWDDAAWSPAAVPPPPTAPPPAVPAGWDGTQPLLLGRPQETDEPDPDPLEPTAGPGPNRPVGLWAALAGVIAVLVVIIALVIRWAGGPVGPATTGSTAEPTLGPTTQVCPPTATGNTRVAHPGDDRVYGGKLSYPRLGDPWSWEQTDEDRIPFGRDVASQEIVIHEEPLWLAGVFVGQLYAGDGFYSPEAGSDIVNRCIFGQFYGDTPLQKDTLRSEAYSVDGYNGWITETNLSFSIPGLPTTSELAIVIIVATSELSSSIFFASIPNDAMQYKPDVDRAIAGLRVEP